MKPIPGRRFLAILCTSFVTNAFSAEIVDFAGKDPSVDELTSALMAKRGVGRAGVNLDVTFESGSDQLTQRSKQLLDKLGIALNSEMIRSQAFELEGHTDAAGSAEYNLRLSKRRANSVKQYLVSSHDIESRRLVPIGKGEAELKNPDDPTSSENRRVTILTQSKRPKNRPVSE